MYSKISRDRLKNNVTGQKNCQQQKFRNCCSIKDKGSKQLHFIFPKYDFVVQYVWTVFQKLLYYFTVMSLFLSFQHGFLAQSSLALFNTDGGVLLHSSCLGSVFLWMFSSSSRSHLGHLGHFLQFQTESPTHDFALGVVFNLAILTK